MVSLLFTILGSAKAYADESSQSMGNGNICSPQSNGNDNSYECNIHIHNYPSENTPSVNQPSPSIEETKSTYSTNSGGLTPTPKPAPQISNSGGLTPTPKPAPQISTY